MQMSHFVGVGFLLKCLFVVRICGEKNSRSEPNDVFNVEMEYVGVKGLISLPS